MRLPLLALLVGCSGAQPPAVECRDDGDCPGISICTDAQECEAVDCLTSAQCGLNSFCDSTTYRCEDGCQADDDCLSGSTCDVDTATCVQSQCTDSQIDCHFGDACNQDIGECEAVEEMCAPCSGVGATTCREDIGGECLFFTAGAFCLPPCSPFTDPAKNPRGFICLDLDDGDAENFHLFGDCNQVDAFRNPDMDTE